MEKSGATVYLLIGGNLGDRKQYLANARMKIDERIGNIESASSIYQTVAWGKTDQPDFLNQALHLTTLLTPIQVLDEILYIEEQLGRKRVGRWTERTIDIDILFYGTEIVTEPRLTIPHPLLPHRAFALLPLEEIAPDFIHPIFEQTISQLRTKLNNDLPVEKLNFET